MRPAVSISLPSDKAHREKGFFLSLWLVRQRCIGCCLCLQRCWSGSAQCLQRCQTIRSAKSRCAVWSSGWQIVFLPWCYDLLYFIKNECEPGIKCSAFSSFMPCIRLVVLSYFHKEWCSRHLGSPGDLLTYSLNYTLTVTLFARFTCVIGISSTLTFLVGGLEEIYGSIDLYYIGLRREWQWLTLHSEMVSHTFLSVW